MIILGFLTAPLSTYLDAHLTLQYCISSIRSNQFHVCGELKGTTNLYLWRLLHMCNILHYLFVSTEFGRKPGKVIHFPVVHYYICLEKLLKGYGLSWIEFYVRQVECHLFFRKLTGVYSTIFEHVNTKGFLFPSWEWNLKYNL